MMSKEKNWDSWKKKENYIERSIHRQEAEREQLVRDTKEDFHGNDHLIFRDEFLGLIAPEYTIELKLHSVANPHVTIQDKARKLVAIITLGGLIRDPNPEEIVWEHLASQQEKEEAEG